MPLTWDPAKRAANLAKHGVDLADAEVFEWGTALVEADLRGDYGEVRLIALGLIGARGYVVVFTIRRTSTRIISMRKASQKEARRYAQES